MLAVRALKRSRAFVSSRRVQAQRSGANLAGGALLLRRALNAIDVRRIARSDVEIRLARKRHRRALLGDLAAMRPQGVAGIARLFDEWVARRDHACAAEAELARNAVGVGITDKGVCAPEFALVIGFAFALWHFPNDITRPRAHEQRACGGEQGRAPTGVHKVIVDDPRSDRNRMTRLAPLLVVVFGFAFVGVFTL